MASVWDLSRSRIVVFVLLPRGCDHPTCSGRIRQRHLNPNHRVIGQTQTFADFEFPVCRGVLYLPLILIQATPRRHSSPSTNSGIDNLPIRAPPCLRHVGSIHGKLFPNCYVLTPQYYERKLRHKARFSIGSSRHHRPV